MITNVTIPRNKLQCAYLETFGGTEVLFGLPDYFIWTEVDWGDSVPIPKYDLVIRTQVDRILRLPYRIEGYLIQYNQLCESYFVNINRERMQVTTTSIVVQYPPIAKYSDTCFKPNISRLCKWALVISNRNWKLHLPLSTQFNYWTIRHFQGLDGGMMKFRYSGGLTFLTWRFYSNEIPGCRTHSNRIYEDLAV